MNCPDLEILLCDYVDGTLDAERKAEVSAHLAECHDCAELVADAAAAVAFMERAAVVEVPQELITRILFEAPIKKQRERRGLRRLLADWLHPVLQPRFAMGMAMTILSFSMLGQFAGIRPRALKAEDLQPAKVVQAIEDRVHRAWERAVKYYDSLRLVYEIQSRLKEFTEPEEGEARTPPAKPAESRPQQGAAPAAPNAAAEGRR
jgi:anti-sigma factor RsiW